MWAGRSWIPYSTCLSMLEDSPWTLHFCDAVLGDSRTNRGQAEISLHSRTWSPDFVPCHPNPSRGRRLESIHHREAAISASAGHARSLLNFRKAEGQAYEGIEPPRPNIAEDNPAAWHRCMPQTDVLPTVHVPATTAVHGPCPPKPPPPFVPRRYRNMSCLGATREVSHYGRVGQFAFRPGIGARERALIWDENRTAPLS